MVLVDSNVVIALTKSNDAAFLTRLITVDAHVVGIVRAEVLTGARSATQIQDLTAALNAFGQLPFPDGLWDQVGLNRSSLESRGVVVPFNDTALATLSIHFDIEFWTRDKHFAMILGILPALKLVQLPTP